MRRKFYTVQYWVNQTGWITFENKFTGKQTVYTKVQSARRQARRIRRHGTPNHFSGCGRIYPDSVQVNEMEGC